MPTKVKVTFERVPTTPVRVSLSENICAREHLNAIEDAQDKVDKLIWLGSQAFDHFLLTQVVNSSFILPSKEKDLWSLLRAVMTEGHFSERRPYATRFRRDQHFQEWARRWNEVDKHTHTTSITNLSNELTFAIKQYTTNFINHCKRSLVDYHVRLQKIRNNCSREKAKKISKAMLIRSWKKTDRKTPWLFDIFCDDADDDADDQASYDDEAIEEITSVQDAVKFMAKIRLELEQLDGKLFTLAPISRMQSQCVRIDEQALRNITDDDNLTLPDTFAVRPSRRHRKMGPSIITNGCYVGIQWIAKTPVEYEKCVSKSLARDILEKRAKRSLEQQKKDAGQSYNHRTLLSKTVRTLMCNLDDVHSIIFLCGHVTYRIITSLQKTQRNIFVGCRKEKIMAFCPTSSRSTRESRTSGPPRDTTLTETMIKNG